MFHAFSGLVVLVLLALWSFTVWALHALAAWSVANAGGLVAGTGSVADLHLPGWLAPWVPAELAQALVEVLRAAAPMVEAALAWAPALATGLTVVAWVVWAIGSAVLVAVGLALGMAVAVWRRRAAVQPRS